MLYISFEGKFPNLEKGIKSPIGVKKAYDGGSNLLYCSDCDSAACSISAEQIDGGRLVYKAYQAKKRNTRVIENYFGPVAQSGWSVRLIIERS